MEQEILQSIKEESRKRQEKREYFSNLLEQLEKLEEDENVKKYVELRKKTDSVDYQKLLEESDEDILYRTFYRHQYMIKNTNEIYVCLGTFMLDNICDIEHGPSDIRLNRNDPRAEYRIYSDLENEVSRQIPISRCEEFERTHRVIFPQTSLTQKYYYQLQKEFISLVVTEGQEKACQKILSKKHK